MKARHGGWKGDLFYANGFHAFVGIVGNDDSEKRRHSANVSVGRRVFCGCFEDGFTEANFADMWKATYGKYFPQGEGQWFYHVMDASGVSREDWQHNDFPYDRVMREEPDTSVFTWRPSRANPSQLDAQVQAKTQATLGKHAIFVPPELDEKMKNDPALARKVASAVERVYSFHRPQPFLPMPGTKFYGTKTYGSVIVLNAEGEVEHACVTSGGGMIGPDEHTLRQIEQEQAKKRARREAAHRIAVEAAEKHWRLAAIYDTQYLKAEVV